jgi:hypothetical protein
MYLCACWIVVACGRSCICVLIESLLPAWPITGHNDSTSTQIHDRSQATTIPLEDKYMTDNRPQRFNKHTNTWPIHIFACLLNRCGLWTVMYLSASGIVVACDRSCICVLVESLLPVIGHVFVCLLNRCGLCSQPTTIPLAHKNITAHRPQRFH